MTSWLRFGHDIHVIGDSNDSPGHPRNKRCGSPTEKECNGANAGAGDGKQEEPGCSKEPAGLTGMTSISRNDMQLIFTTVNSRHVHDPHSPGQSVQHALSFPEYLEAILHLAYALHMVPDSNLVDADFISAALDQLLLKTILPYARREDVLGFRHSMVTSAEVQKGLDDVQYILAAIHQQYAAPAIDRSNLRDHRERMTISRTSTSASSGRRASSGRHACQEGVTLQRWTDLVRDAGLIGDGASQISFQQALKAFLDSEIVSSKANADATRWPPPLPPTFELTEDWLDQFGSPNGMHTTKELPQRAFRQQRFIVWLVATQATKQSFGEAHATKLFFVPGFT
ncbi:hypothetical protein AB1Y20_016880 [Prymnesium parvum]|uniref:Uncharacterized protein n=1 Tax=Prymnesium parvum TaxID=97485 RepID=A0AB34IDC1_PRYPA